MIGAHTLSQADTAAVSCAPPQQPAPLQTVSSKQIHLASDPLSIRSRGRTTESFCSAPSKGQIRDRLLT
jgi:hypothetical protein